MRPEPDITRIVRSWLDEGVDRLPDRVFDSVLEQLPTTPQRRSAWSAWRLRPMTSIVRVAVVAAAVIVAAVAGISLLPGAGVGGPAASATPTASPSPTPPDAVVNSSLKAGTYRVGSPFRQPFTITFPGEWTPKTIIASDVQLRKTLPESGAPWIVVDIPDNVYADPCQTADGTPEPAVPSTVDGLVTALTNMTGFSAGPVTDASINGRVGKTFVLTNAIDTETANCTGGAMLPMWTFPGGASGTNGGATEQIWVIDVGGTPVIIDGESFPNTLAADKATIESIATSIAFE